MCAHFIFYFFCDLEKLKRAVLNCVCVFVYCDLKKIGGVIYNFVRVHMILFLNFFWFLAIWKSGKNCSNLPLLLNEECKNFVCVIVFLFVACHLEK
jgi:hypothetical protein